MKNISEGQSDLMIEAKKVSQLIQRGCIDATNIIIKNL